MTLDEARKILTTAARSWSEGDPLDNVTLRELCNAACEYARVRESLRPTRAAAKPEPTHDRDAILPFGRSKGLPVSEAPLNDLSWIRDRIEESVDDPTKARWRESNERLLEAIEGELDFRSAR